jgi:hypothetical protein
MMERKARMMTMMEIDELRNAVANLQIDNYQIGEKFSVLEEKLEIIELKMNEILEVVGNPHGN